MLSADIQPHGSITTPTAPDPGDGMVSLIGLAGAWAGTGSIMCSASVGCRVCAHMLQTEAPAVSGEVLDALAELTNMIIGGVKNDLEAHVGPLGLSIPTVIFGRNFQTKSAAHTQWVVERFRWDDDEFVVKLCLAPYQKPGHPTVPPAGQSREGPAAGPGSSG